MELQPRGPIIDQSSALASQIGTQTSLVRAITLFHLIQWAAIWFAGYFTANSTEIQEFHLTQWGFDIFFFSAWAILLFLVGCGPQALRRSPLQWMVYVFFTLLSAAIASACVSYFDAIQTLFEYSVGLGAIGGVLVYVLSHKARITLPDASLYILAGVAIFYQGFIIFTDESLVQLIITALVGIGLGLYYVFDVTNYVCGTFYGLQPGQAAAGSVIVWLEYFLFLLRIFTAIGSAFRV